MMRLTCVRADGEHQPVRRRVKRVRCARMTDVCVAHGSFIEAAQKLGVKEQDVFATVDLFEAKNMTKVIDTLAALKRVTGQ